MAFVRVVAEEAVERTRAWMMGRGSNSRNCQSRVRPQLVSLRRMGTLEGVTYCLLGFRVVLRRAIERGQRWKEGCRRKRHELPGSIW